MMGGEIRNKCKRCKMSLKSHNIKSKQARSFVARNSRSQATTNTMMGSAGYRRGVAASLDIK
jgi:hypothetical protein